MSSCTKLFIFVGNYENVYTITNSFCSLYDYFKFYIKYFLVDRVFVSSDITKRVLILMSHDSSYCNEKQFYYKLHMAYWIGNYTTNR